MNQPSLSQSPDATNPPPSGPARSPRFHGSGGTLFGILIVNALLTIVTLGIYYWWGKAKLRRYLFSQMELEGDRFAFSGTGGELFLGFLKVAAVGLGLAAVLGLGVYLGEYNVGIRVVSVLFCYGVLLYLLPYAVVGSRRYLLSRTSWRDVTFSFRGTVADFSWLFIKGTLLTIVTLGFYSPYLMNTVYSFSVNHSYYGSRRFHYDGDGDVLFWGYLKTIGLGVGVMALFVALGVVAGFTGNVGLREAMLILPMFGMFAMIFLGCWFAALRARYFAAHTSAGSLRFESTLTGGKILVLVLTNLLLLIFTAGLAMPWIIIRTMRFQFDNLIVRGSLDTTDVRSEKDQVSGTGDAMADALGVEAGLDVGLGL